LKFPNDVLSWFVSLGGGPQDFRFTKSDLQSWSLEPLLWCDEVNVLKPGGYYADCTNIPESSVHYLSYSSS